MNDTTVENGYYAANLKANTFYYLVETKSPVGFNLLAQPVLFKIITDENGNQQVQFYDPATKQIKQNGGALAGYFKKDGAESTSVAYVQVADVRQTGTLPRTGGNGIGAPVLAALVIFAAAGIFMRRRA